MMIITKLLYILISQMSILLRENASGPDSGYPLPELTRSTEYTEHFAPAATFRMHSELKLPPCQPQQERCHQATFLSVWRYSGHQPREGG